MSLSTNPICYENPTGANFKSEQEFSVSTLMGTDKNEWQESAHYISLKHQGILFYVQIKSLFIRCQT